MNDPHLFHLEEFFLSDPQLLAVKAPCPGVDWRSRSRDVMEHLMFNLPVEILNQEAWEIFQQRFIWSSCGKAETKNLGWR